MSRHPGPHDSRGATPAAYALGLLTISDTRTENDDESGRVLRELALASGHRVYAAAIVPDDPETVRDRVLAWSLDEACDAIVTSGGTGLSARDRSVEAVSGLFDLRIDGFGELFRALSFADIGSRAMLSRALAGVVHGTPVFLLPGSPAAVRLGMTRLVLPEVGHAVAELRRHEARS